MGSILCHSTAWGRSLSRDKMVSQVVWLYYTFVIMGDVDLGSWSFLLGTLGSSPMKF